MGAFAENAAMKAPVLFKMLGVLYLFANMPPWMRFKLGGGVLRPSAKSDSCLVMVLTHAR